MDLPRELRELIYSYAGLSKRRAIDLRENERGRKWWARLPPLLKIGGRLQMEAAEHYFSASTFDIIAEDCYLLGFFDWFRRIGEENRKRLLSNAKVTVRIQHSHGNCRKEGHTSSYQAPRPAPSTDFLNGLEVMHVSQLTERYVLLVSQSPAPIYKLDKWLFTTECPRVIWPNWAQPSPGSRARNEFSYFSLDSVKRFQAMMRGTLAKAEGSEPIWLDQGDRKELCIGKADKDIYAVTLPTSVGNSTRMLYIRKHKRRKG